MSTSQPLKHLQVRESQIEAELESLSRDLQDIESKKIDKTRQLAAIKKEIYEITKVKPVVSEHALLRYCERVLNVDLRKIESEMLSDKNIEIINQIRSGKIPMDGCRLVVKNKVIVTIET